VQRNDAISVRFRQWRIFGVVVAAMNRDQAVRMRPLHRAAKDGRLDDCRRLVEEEGEDVNEIDGVSVCVSKIAISCH
jgi:hypothetical protein